MITLADLSPFDRRREMLGRQRDDGLLTRRQHAKELQQIEREERRERIARAAKRAASVARRGVARA